MSERVCEQMGGLQSSVRKAEWERRACKGVQRKTPRELSAGKTVGKCHVRVPGDAKASNTEDDSKIIKIV